MNGLRACCLLLLWPVLGQASEALRLVANPWPPFTDQRMANGGVATELVTTALTRAGYRTQYNEVPWERAIRGLQRDDYDVLVNAWYTDERARFGYFSQPYLINRVRFMQRKGAGIRYQSLVDLYPYSIAVVRGYAYSSEFDQDSRLTKVGVLGFETGARMLHARRVQLMVEDELVARFYLGRELRSIRNELEFLPQPLSENGLHILVSRQHPQHKAIAEAFDQAIEAMHADGTYAEIFARHGL
ncbi:transporter substrate-binding domain-containing protein [Pseudomonas sp. GD03944]|uniref:substrate-binding periplasmic protein n=1 Tax=Pseudomonas sp. GD03944 TaxID=2975409 RepID=UPI002447D06F|nr:transporter substrate-binding domain-containing protein [Pseudomonas sp. GD03944]MDH1263042.1 transporter substrate-binding domain-containing protein [Pseudomonas sp. GD03944]